MEHRFTALGFDLAEASVRSLREALPGWEIQLFAGPTSDSRRPDWDRSEVDLIVVEARGPEAETLALCHLLLHCTQLSRDNGKESANALGPRGSLQTKAQRDHAPLFVLVSAGQEGLVKAALEAGAHGCLILPVDAKEVASMLARARAGNQPGRHTDTREQAQGQDRWRDEGGEG